MTYDALITALENIVLDNVMTAPIVNSRMPGSKNRNPDRSRLVFIGIAAKDDHDETKSGEGQRIADIAARTVYTGAGHKGSWVARQWSELEVEHELGSTRQMWQESVSWRTELLVEGWRQERRKGSPEGRIM